MIDIKTDLKAQQALIERAKTNPDAFGIIFDAHYDMILGYSMKRTGDIAVAQDITSEVFIKALKNINKFTWQNVPISAWLYKIASNELRMNFRGFKHVASLDELRESSNFEPIDETNFLEELTLAQDAAERQRDSMRAHELIATLGLKYQEVIVLRFGEEKKIGEIAIILGKSEGTIKSLLSRAMKKLRIAMEKSEMQPNSPNSIIQSEGQTIKPQDTYER